MARKFPMHPGIVLPLVLGGTLGGVGVGSAISDHVQENHDLRGDHGPEAAAQAGLVKAAREAVARGTTLRVYLGSLEGPFMTASCAPASQLFNRETSCAFTLGADQVTPDIEFALKQPRGFYAHFPSLFPLAKGGIAPDCQQTASGWTCTAHIDRDDLREAKRAELTAAPISNSPIQTR